MNGPYLTFFPQFCHERINDRAWYPGFTDWDLIRDLPGDVRKRFTPAVGFYDLAARADIAAQFGAIGRGPWSSIALYHYYFDGHFALQEVEKFILDTDDAVPRFFTIWANETWSKRWLGRAHDVIMRQNHSTDAAIVTAHTERLCMLFQHPSYARMDGRPIFVIYAAYEIPHVAQLVRAYRAAFERRGVNPLIGFCVSYVDRKFAASEFDFCVEFQPRLFFNVMRAVTGPHTATVGLMLKQRIPWLYERVIGVRDRRHRERGMPRKFFDYCDYLTLLEQNVFPKLLHEAYGLPVVRSLFYSWNNYPRYRGGAVAVRHHDGDYQRFLALMRQWSATEPWFLVNSWNEWSEGAALEAGELPPQCYESALDGAQR